MFLELTFDPPATVQQLAAVRALLPGLMVVGNGAFTAACSFDEDEIVEACEAAGINGHGYLVDGTISQVFDCDRFVFGHCPEMAPRVEAVRARLAAQAAVLAAQRELVEVALAGDDGLAEAAARLRAAVAGVGS